MRVICHFITLLTGVRLCFVLFYDQEGAILLYSLLLMAFSGNKESQKGLER